MFQNTTLSYQIHKSCQYGNKIVKNFSFSESPLHGCSLSNDSGERRVVSDPPRYIFETEMSVIVAAPLGPGFWAEWIAYFSYSCQLRWAIEEGKNVSTACTIKKTNFKKVAYFLSYRFSY
jgi:hypothetical protein